MQNINQQPENLVAFDGEKLTTDSRIIAKAFNKAHKTVLRAYDNLQCSDEFKRHNYVPSEYADERGKIQRCVSITKDGFVMLAMGFTGTRAIEFKEAYIAAFNDMAERINNHDKNLWQQMNALIAREIESKIRASFGSHLMLTRKKEIPPLRDERQILEDAIQTSLLN